jgi:thiamine-monophosphate kinase
VTRESDFLDMLRPLAMTAAARGFNDDAAVLEVRSGTLVLTHDMIVEGVHFLPGDPPADVAWKLVAANLSDLAAKGAKPVAALLGYTLGDEAWGVEWDRAFVAGLSEAIEAFDLALLGGDTVSAPAGAPRSLGLTAIGSALPPVPARSGALPSHLLWVSGTIGDAGAGLRILRGEIEGAEALVRRYRRPQPRLAAGERLAPLASAMMDVSDGLLIDARRIATASAVAITIELDLVPLSDAYRASGGNSLAAATAGDDYELLFTAPVDAGGAILDVAEILGLPLTAIGRVGPGAGLHLSEAGAAIPLPGRLGWEHR